MNTDEYLQTEPAALRSIHEQRGFVITKAIHVESLIDQCIMKYFIRGNRIIQEQFHDDFLKYVNLSRKNDLIKSLIKRIEIELKGSEYEVLPGLIEKIRIRRNEMAHWHWVVHTEEVTVLRGAIQKDPARFNAKKLKSLKEDCDKCLYLLNKLYQYQFTYQIPSD